MQMFEVNVTVGLHIKLTPPYSLVVVNDVYKVNDNFIVTSHCYCLADESVLVLT